VAFVVEDGTGLANATSYTSTTFADAYHEDRGNFAWTEAPIRDRERALIRATDFLDSRYEWQGLRLTDTQALAWPRLGATTNDCVLLESDSIPVAVQQATAEMGLAALCGELEPNIQKAEDAVVSSQRAGTLEVRTESRGSVFIFPRAARLLNGLGSFRTLLRT
jgi:hypothetical protein